MTKEEKMQLPMIIDKVFIEQKINAYTNKRDGWIPESAEYAAYDLVIREYKCVLSQLMPLPTLPDEEENIDTEKEELIAEISKLQQTVKSLESALDNISQNGNS